MGVQVTSGASRLQLPGGEMAAFAVLVAVKVMRLVAMTAVGMVGVAKVPG